jgi:predicted trehalose synthase
VSEIALLDWVLGEPAYDARCERVETAVKALWLLWMRRKWDLLEMAGLSRDEVDPLFTAYDATIERHRLDDHAALGLLLYARAKGSIHLIRLLSACFWMIGKYRARKLTGQGVVIR